MSAICAVTIKNLTSNCSCLSFELGQASSQAASDALAQTEVDQQMPQIARNVDIYKSRGRILAKP